MNVTDRLFSMQDESYREFHSRLMPGVDKQRVIGVRIPDIRKLAKEMLKDGSAEEFISVLPHFYYEENNLHAFIICSMTDIERVISEVNRFLPYVDNWATCDSMRPVIFPKHKQKVLQEAEKWMKSKDEFTVRFGIECMMNYFLGDDFRDEYAEAVSLVQSEKYYVNMMIAWYFATALSKNYDRVIGYLEEEKLPLWVHNKTISKANESFRINGGQKSYLKTLKK